MDEKMTLEQVRDDLRIFYGQDKRATWMRDMADAIDAHLAQPAQAVNVGAIRKVIDSLSAEADAHDNEGMPGTAAYLSRQAIKLTRALSTAQGQGEAVAWMCETVNGYKAFSAAPNFPCNTGKVTPLYTHPAPPASPAGVPDELRELSELASSDWKVGGRSLGGGPVLGGATFQYANGPGQTQIASFSCPRLEDDDPRDVAAVQDANVRFAVECVNFVRGLLAAAR